MSELLDQFAGEAAAADAAAAPEQFDIPGEEGAGAEAGPAPEPMMTPEEEAERLIELTAWGIGKIWPVLEYTPEVKAEGARKLAPVLRKYPSAIGDFVARWGVEIEAGVFFGGVVYGSIIAVKNAPKEEAKQERGGWWRRFFRGEQK